MLETFRALFEWIREYIPPWKIIRIDEQGSKFRSGNPVGILSSTSGVFRTGFHFFVPYFEQISVFTIAYQGIILDSQDNATSDDIPLKFQMYIGYDIFDAQKMDVQVADFDQTLHGEAMSWLAMKISEKTYTELLDNRKAICTELKRSLDTLVAPWGVKIRRVGFKSFVKSKQYTFHSTTF